MYILPEEMKCLDDKKFKIELKLLLFDLSIYDIKEFILYFNCNRKVMLSFVYTMLT